MIRSALILGIYSFCFGSHQFAIAQTGVVKANGVPVPGASVSATLGDKTLTTFTDDRGQYRLDGMTDGSWTLEVQMFRFAPQQKQVDVKGGFKLDWDLALAPLSPAPVVAATTPKAVSPKPPASRPADGQTATPPRRYPQDGGAPGQMARRGPPGQQQPNRMQDLTNQLDPTANAGPENTDVPAGTQADSANEAFLLNGTVSRGLQQVNGDPGGDQNPGFGRGPGEFGDGQNGPGGPGGDPAGGPGGGGMGGGRGGPGGFGGGGGGFGGGGFGGRGGGGGGGFGGPGGRRPDFRGGRGTDSGLIGNRRNRGQQGIHGMVNVVLHNSLLDARPFAVNGQEIAKPSYSKERFSFQIGGPLMIPKLFKLENTTFNLNFTSNRSTNLVSQVGTVPTLAERNGDFSQSNRIIYDPNTHAPYPNNQIPAGQLNPIALTLLNYFPLPNQNGSCGASLSNGCNAQNYQFTTTAPNNNESIGLRLGQSIGKKDRLALNFQYQNRSGVTPQIFGFLDNTSGDGYSVNLNWIHTFAPRVFNTASVSFNRNATNLIPFFANGTSVATAIGILGTSQNPLDYGPPNLAFTNFAGLTDGSASLTRVQSINFNEAFSWIRGKHTIRFGGLYSHSQNNLRTDSNGRGTFNFTGLTTSGFDSNGQPLSNTGYDFADFLIGLPNSATIRYGDTSTYFRSNNYSFFGNDDWRVSSTLSLNLGLRYEYYGVPYEKFGHEANLDIASNFSAAAAVVAGGTGPYSGAFPQGLVNADRNNFAPRIGIAWRPRKNGKTVVRTGYGIYYNGAAYNGFARNLAAQPPFANTNSVITSSAAVLTLATGFLVTPPGKTVTNSWAIDRNYRLPYAQTWNLTIQRDLPRNIVLQVGYLGTKGTRLDTQLLPNRAAPGSPLTAEERRLIANATGFVYETSDANSIYHSARVTLIRRFGRGTSFNIDYIFSKAIDDASTFGGGLVQNEQDIRAERSLSNFDHRHVLNASYVFTSPFGHNSKLLTGHVKVNKLLEDWTLTGGVQAQTGAPLSPRVAGNQSDSAGTGANGTTRPDATGLPIEAGSGYFNTAAFVLPQPGFFGNAGRNTIPGPGSVVMNSSFGRAFGLGERRLIEFRLDASNLLNHVNITGIGTTINASTYGLPLAAGAMRSVGITLRFRF